MPVLPSDKPPPAVRPTIATQPSRTNMDTAGDSATRRIPKRSKPRCDFGIHIL